MALDPLRALLKAKGEGSGSNVQAATPSRFLPAEDLTVSPSMKTRGNLESSVNATAVRGPGGDTMQFSSLQKQTDTVANGLQSLAPSKPDPLAAKRMPQKQLPLFEEVPDSIKGSLLEDHTKTQDPSELDEEAGSSPVFEDHQGLLDPLSALRATKLKSNDASKMPGQTADGAGRRLCEDDVLGEGFLAAVFAPSSRAASSANATRHAAGYRQPASSATSSGPLQQQKHDQGGHWHCALCRAPTVPVVGALAKPLLIGQGARHHCRTCGRTVCASCSLVVNGSRICSGCNLKERITLLPGSHPEKIIFFVRHAKSIWNEAMSSGVSEVASEFTTKDHGLSSVGFGQTDKLRRKLAQGFSDWASTSQHFMEKAEHVHQYYSTFFQHRYTIYCSPLLRALQTAHLSFPSEDGWGNIKLLKDARELYRFATERDCVGTAIGTDIANRAEREGRGMNGLRQRVDCSDCLDMWWSQTPENGREIELRQESLWETLLHDDECAGCIVVTHSNMIRTLLARFSSMENNCDRCDLRKGQVCDRALCCARNHKLDHCSVLGVRCVFGGVETLRDRPGQRKVWVAQDAHLMFGSQFVGKG